MTKEKIVSDLILRLTGGKPSDDMEFDYNQCLDWLDQARSAAVSQWIRQSGGMYIPPGLFKRYECQSFTTETPECVFGGCFSNTYLDIERPISLREERGIRISRQNGRTLNRLTSPQEYQIIKRLRFAKEDTFWYRVGERVYFIGNEKINHNYKFIVDLVPASTSSLADTDQYPIIEELYPTIMAMAEEIGLRQAKVPIDINNDGKP